MTDFEIDASELNRLALDLSRAGDDLVGKVRPVVSKAALNVKTDWNAALLASEHFKAAGGTVNYDLTRRVGDVEAEVGQDLDRFPGQPGKAKAKRAAALAGFAHFGGAHGGGGSVAGPQTFAAVEVPRLEKALNDVIDGLLR